MEQQSPMWTLKRSVWPFVEVCVVRSLYRKQFQTGVCLVIQQHFIWFPSKHEETVHFMPEDNKGIYN